MAVGWSDVNFTLYSDVANLRDKVYEEYYEKEAKAPQVVSRNLNEVERFKSMKKGDYVIVPYYSFIAIAEVEDKELYSIDSLDLDLSNQRSVTYRYSNGKLLKIPRNELSEGLQRRLRVRGSTVSNLFEFSDEIDKLFNRKSYSYSQEMQEREILEINDLKNGILKNIQEGKTNLQTGGIGLERLVSELMQCEGYKTEVMAKTTFKDKADADIRAIKEDSFMSKKIFVQVKHHSGFSGKEGIQQIIDVINDNEYRDYDGYFITSAMISDEDRRFANSNGIEVMDGNDLADLIVSNISALSETTKRLLGICSIPHIISI